MATYTLGNLMSDLNKYNETTVMAAEYPSISFTKMSFKISSKVSLSIKDLREFIAANKPSNNLLIYFDGDPVKSIVYDADDKLILFII